mmetsp:Transcript_67949/g.221180  ORF Transcript_67949/g.221180 Transcript_67949/m.221180 type:complete len:462 (-) Transcript_67949:3433-4818(-)
MLPSLGTHAVTSSSIEPSLPFWRYARCGASGVLNGAGHGWLSCFSLLGLVQLAVGLPVDGGAQASVRNALEQLLHLRGALHETVVPEVEAPVLDQLDEGYQQPPRMRPVDDQALQQHPGDLLANHLIRRVCEQVEQHATEVVRVRVRVAQVVGDGAQEQVPPLIVQVVCQVHEDVQGRVVLLHATLSGQRLAMLWQVHPHVQEQGVEQWDVVLRVQQQGILLRQPQLVLDGLQQPLLARPHEGVHVVLQVLLKQRRRVARQDSRSHLYLGQQINLQVGHERVRQLHVPREGRQDQVTDLHARDRHDVTKREVVVAQELREVMQQDQQGPHCPLVQQSGALVELHTPQVGLQEVQQLHQQSLEHQPTALVLDHEQLWHEHAVADEFQPSEREVRHAQRVARVERVAERRQELEVHGLEVRIRSADVHEQVQEDAEVGSLIELHPFELAIPGELLGDRRKCTR